MKKVTVKKLPQSLVEIEGELDADIFEQYYPKALKKLGQNVKIDGFRTGKIPEGVLVSNIPEVAILEEMAEMALSDHYPKIVEDEKLDAIARPEISITKLARKNPLGFKIKTAVLPEIKLADYKGIAKKIIYKKKKENKEITVSDEDVENTIMDIRKSRAPKKHLEDVPTETDTQETEPVIEELPEFNDDFVRALGPFSSVEDFKSKLKENIKIEKENQAKEKTRLDIIEKVIEESLIDVPDVLVEMEVDKILYRMEGDITNMGLKFEDYLKHLNKSVEDLRKDFKTDANKKAKLSLILNEIAKIEKIAAETEHVEKEVANLLAMYKDADPERARMHAENVLTNEKIFEFLEKL